MQLKMKTTEPILIDFITDFNLESPSRGTVCFEARIQFEAQDIYKQVESEVHIITINNKNLTVFYLLDPDISTHHIPDTLYFNAADAVYHKNISLELRGVSALNGDYVLIITPTTAHCADSTLYELRAKKDN
jgi:hypothetical protein